MRKFRMIIAAVLTILLLVGCANSGSGKPSGNSGSGIPSAKEILNNRLKEAFRENEKFSGGSGTEEDPYLISTADDLFRLADQINGETNGYAYREAHYRMTNDIDLGGKKWMPIGVGDDFGRYGLMGVFDGNGYTVSGMKVTSSADDVITDFGLFGNVKGTIKNLTVAASELDTRKNEKSAATGAVAGSVDFEGLIENCHAASDVTVNGSYESGGITGHCNGMITGCTNAAAVTGSSVVGKVGGIVGIMSGTPRLAPTSGYLENCTNTGAVVSAGDEAGGVVGMLLSVTKMTGCANSGAVSCENTAGGIVGTIHSADTEGTMITDCTNSGSISGKETGGGIVGVYGGGSLAIVRNCANSGPVSDGTYMGGVVGFARFSGQQGNLQIAECANSGELSANEQTDVANAGGIVGLILAMGGDFTLENCVNTGNVNGGDGDNGGILGGYLSALGSEDSTMTLSIAGCSNSGNVSGGSFGVGGVVGRVAASGYPEVEFTVTDCTNSGSLYACGTNVLMGGIVANIAPHHCMTVVRNCVNTGDLSCELVQLESGDGWFPFDSAMGGVVGYVGANGIAPTLDDDCGRGDQVVVTIDGCSSTGAIHTNDGGVRFHTDDICAMSAVGVEIQ